VRKSAGFGLALIAVVAGTVLSAAPAAAHAVLTGSSPEDGATLEAPPTVVELEFNEPIQRDFTQVAVLDSDDNHYEHGDAEVIGGTVTQAVTGLGGGDYRISYRVGSADGHPVSGVLTFTVVSDIEPAPPGSNGETGTASGDRDWVPIAVSAATVILVATAGAVMIARRRNPRPGSDDRESQTGP
jgi:methionine-rich copper-binding protein CopC